MLDLLNHQDIINHLHNYSKIYKLNNQQDWIQILCPYCDDAIRKENITHGHFYISRKFNFGKCFRCDSKVSAKKLLIDIGFENRNLLNNIFKFNKDINYYSEIKQGIFDKDEILIKHTNFQKANTDNYQKFVNYIYKRIGNIDFNQFLIYPTAIENKLCVGFNNSLNEISTVRFIFENNIKYYKLQTSVNYFFQPQNNFKNIVVCEGAFDLINLYKYSTVFDNKSSFYIALNGRSYISNLSSIIIENYMIGEYVFNIVFDKDVKYLDSLKKQINLKINLLNPNIIIKYYIPVLAKDVSEFNYISSI